MEQVKVLNLDKVFSVTNKYLKVECDIHTQIFFKQCDMIHSFQHRELKNLIFITKQHPKNSIYNLTLINSQTPNPERSKFYPNST